MVNFLRRWSWTAKRAEPYNIRGGHIDWTKNPMMRKRSSLFFLSKTRDFNPSCFKTVVCKSQATLIR